MISLQDLNAFVDEFPELEMVKNDTAYAGRIYETHILSVKGVLFEYNSKDKWVKVRKPTIVFDEDDIEINYIDFQYRDWISNIKELRKKIKKILYFVEQCQQTIKLMKQFNKKLEIDGDFTNDSKRI